MSWLDRIIEEGARLTLQVEKIDLSESAGQELIKFRKNQCLNCVHVSENAKKCLICNCFINIKVETKVNYKTGADGKILGKEITHCPKGFWGDKKIAEEYRKKNLIEKMKNNFK